MKLLDFDTGGGEFLLSLEHPYANTSATEGYPPNVQLCQERLLLGIDLRECADASRIPFEDESFDIIINRHGDFHPAELNRLLRPGGLFITQQVGSNNDRELVETVLPGTLPPFPHDNFPEQKQAFENAGFDEKVRSRQGYVCIEDGKTVGVLRYNLFWDNAPFCTLLFIDSEYRGRGFGRQLMTHWEEEMKASGCGMVMTSTQVDEDAQHFNRKLGYRDAGGFVVGIPGYEQPMEMIMIKALWILQCNVGLLQQRVACNSFRSGLQWNHGGVLHEHKKRHL